VLFFEIRKEIREIDRIPSLGVDLCLHIFEFR
jgi:hypothetical protein